MRLSIARVTLPFKRILNISRENYAAQDLLVVRLEQDGVVGYGEASAFKVYGATLDAMEAALLAVRDSLKSLRLTKPVDLWHELAPRLQQQPFAQCAVDVAAHDLWAKLQGQPLYALLGLNPALAPPSCYTVFIDQPTKMVTDVSHYADWPVIKVKVGIPGDLENVQLIRDHTDASIRVDANTGWTAAIAAEKSKQLAALGVTAIEQPLKVDDWAGMKELAKESTLPLIADESCCTFGDLERCAQVFQGVNIKLMKAGGLTPGLAMISEARRLGLKVMVGCMPESTIGISAIAHVAPLLDFMDADGSELFAKDVASGLRLEKGRFQDNGLPGLGFCLNDQTLFKDGGYS